MAVGKLGGTISDRLEQLTQLLPDAVAFEFLATHSDITPISYRELQDAVLKVAASDEVGGRPGSRALIACQPGLDYVVALLACFRAGVTAVPIYPPTATSQLPRVSAIAQDAGAELVLIDGCETKNRWLDFTASSSEALGKLAVLDVAERRLAARSGSDLAHIPTPTRDAIALIQYTSGSTGAPKGVILTHDNIMANLEMIRLGFSLCSSDKGVLWLPPFHDMGLIGGILAPIYVGFPNLLMTPQSFIRNPLKWLQLISDRKATVAGGPNFGFARVAAQLEKNPNVEIDLSGWKIAFTGAEPIRPATLKRFEVASAPFGFSAEAFLPCYGLAEATLIVSSARRGEGARKKLFSADALEQGEARSARTENDERVLVGCGSPVPGVTLKIVDPSTGQSVAPLQVGEVHVAGPNVASGYTNPKRDPFHECVDGAREPYLATGDLGFCDAEGEIFICGRKTDLIIIRGRNILPQDVEEAVESALPMNGAAVAFGEDDPAGERLIVAREVPTRARMTPEAMLSQIRKAVFDAIGVQADDLLLVKPNSLPKTSSGKIRRLEAKGLYARQGLNLIESSRGQSGTVVYSGGSPEGALVQTVAEVLGLTAGSINVNETATFHGLDSMGALHVCDRLESHHGLRLAPDDLLGTLPLCAVGQSVAAARADDDISGPAQAPGDASERLLVGQQALWHQHRLGAGEALNLPLAMKVGRVADMNRLTACIRRLVDRHPSLRSVIEDHDGAPRLRTRPVGDAYPEIAVWREPLECEADLVSRFEAEAGRALDIEASDVMRCVIGQVSGGDVYLLIVVHHIVADAWSLDILARELAEDYSGSTEQEALGWKADPGLAAVAAAEAAFLASKRGQAQFQALARHFKQAPVRLGLPSDRDPGPVQSFEAGLVRSKLSRTTTHRLRELAKSARTTVFVAVLAALSSALTRLSSTSELVVGTAMASRDDRKRHGIVGPLMNPVALRLQADETMTFKDLIEECQRELERARSCIEAPFSSLVQHLGLSGATGTTPLYQVLASWHRLDLLRSVFAKHGWSHMDISQQGAPTDLNFDFFDEGHRIRWTLRYATTVFDRNTAKRISDTLNLVLDAMLAGVGDAHADVDILRAHDRPLLAQSERLGGKRAREVSGLIQAFQEHAACLPEKDAVIAEGGTVSYGDLLARARSWSATLDAARGGSPDAPVGVLLPKSPDYIAVFMGALMAGLPVVPISVDLPEAQIADILKRSGVRAAVTTPDLLPKCPKGIRVLLTSDQCDAGGGMAAPPPANRLAYIMFSSGSTGRPKGIGVEAAALDATLAALADLLGASSDDVLLSLTSTSFDISILEIFLPLLVGGAVVIGGDGALTSPDTVLAAVKRHGVTLLQATPSTLSNLLERPFHFPELTVLCGGEAAPSGLFGRLFERCGRVLNVYGPTETTIWSSAHRLRDGGNPPLGEPLFGESLHVLNAFLRPAPPGVDGELYIGGSGVARGYVGDPARTAENFLPDPFSSEPGARLYRTGDLVRIRPDGCLEFRGRRDRQLKVRGYRIEPEGVDAVIASYGAVRASITTAVGEGANRKLVSILELPEGSSLDERDLRAFLAKQLPPYAVPSLFKSVDSLPVTSRGKLDLNAALRGMAVPKDEAVQTAPEGEFENALFQIWRNVLERDDFGAESDFFMLGGHSLLAHNVAVRAQTATGRRVKVADVFAFPKLCDLARHIESAALASQPSGIQGGLTSAQRRIWVAEQLQPGLVPNVSIALRVAGPLNLDALRAALERLIAHHDDLRTIFIQEGRNPKPVVLETVVSTLTVEDMSHIRSADREAASLKLAAKADGTVFDLQTGPLLALRLARFDEEDWLLCLTLHHIVTDGEGVKLVLADLAEEYVALTLGRDTALPNRRSIAVAAGNADQSRGTEELLRLLNGYPRAIWGETVDLPSVGPTQTLTARVRTSFRNLSKELNTTPFTVVLSAFLETLRLKTGRQSLIVGTDFAERDDPTSAHCIAPLVNQVPIPVDLSGKTTLAEIVQTVQFAMRAILPLAGTPYDQLMRAANQSRSRSEPLFDTKIIHQGVNSMRHALGTSQLMRLPRTIPIAQEALTLAVIEDDAGASLELHFRPEIVAEALAASILDELEAILAQSPERLEANQPIARKTMEFKRRKAQSRRPALGSGSESADPVPSLTTYRPDETGANLADWVGSNAERLFDTVAEESAVLFRGYDVDTPEKLAAIVKTTGYAAYATREHPREARGKEVFTPIPYPNEERLLWHNEDSFNSEWPAHIWFACGAPAASGGETVVASSSTVLDSIQSIDPRLIDRGLTYVRRYGLGPGLDWKVVFGSEDREVVERQCAESGMRVEWRGDVLTTYATRPGILTHPLSRRECWVGQLLHFHPAALPERSRRSIETVFAETGPPRDCTFGDGTPIPDIVIERIKAAYQAIEVPVHWRQGDLLFVDNVSAAHGRLAYQGSRELLVMMSGRARY
ncbi:non-ribosomal peptide synthetase [Roseovarius sp. M141]|uniref:non-ribosomal peptide synthetase n=1 Tax=Roseovarius sp. M141 TaxID=2583806 RepID=UPI0020CB6E71|nr:non-ribosomal peptide synthetase [Roseovarius sp. M141]